MTCSSPSFRVDASAMLKAANVARHTDESCMVVHNAKALPSEASIIPFSVVGFSGITIPKHERWRS